MDKKFRQLQAILRRYKRLVIAYSGGLDSGFLLWAAVKSLGREHIMAIIADSPSYPSGEKEEALAFAEKLGLDSGQIQVINTNEMTISGYTDNGRDRCFHCKDELYSRLIKIAGENGFPVVADGFNHSDHRDFRPGHKAAKKHGVVSPFAEVELTKNEIIALAKKYKLDLADKPASACLASRIPFGIEITRQRLGEVDRAERGLKDLGFAGLRVRHHGSVARVEFDPSDIPRIFKNGLKDKIVEVVKAAGFVYVTIDLEGYRMGSLNPPTKTAEGESHD